MDRVRISTEIELTNYEDEVLNHKHPRKIKIINAIVDTGATWLTIPENLAKELGLREINKVYVKYANNTGEFRPVSSALKVKLFNREGIFSAVILPEGTNVLVGLPILETLDIWIDIKGKKILPNPASPDKPTIELLNAK